MFIRVAALPALYSVVAYILHLSCQIHNLHIAAVFNSVSRLFVTIMSTSAVYVCMDVDQIKDFTYKIPDHIKL